MSGAVVNGPMDMWNDLHLPGSGHPRPTLFRLQWTLCSWHK